MKRMRLYGVLPIASPARIWKITRSPRKLIELGWTPRQAVEVARVMDETRGRGLKRRIRQAFN
jgi:hypothetical protein